MHIRALRVVCVEHQSAFEKEATIVTGSDWMTDTLKALRQALAVVFTFGVNTNITILLGL